jgi:hypothetical protein
VIKDDTLEEKEYFQMSIGKRNFWLDAVLAVAFVIATVSGLAMWVIDANGPNATFVGVELNTWRHIHPLSVALVGAGVIVHLLWHWKWVKAAFRPGAKPQQVNINRLLDVLLFITFCLVMLSGLGSHGESHAAARALARLDVVQVDPLHGVAGIGMMVIVGVHQVLHWKWIVTTARRTLGIEMLKSVSKPS